MTRERLPSRRFAETWNLEVGGQNYACTIGRFADGRIGEIFLSSSLKAGSAVDCAARDSAIAASLALQHGADIEVIRRALCRDIRGNASGPLGVALDMLSP